MAKEGYYEHLMAYIGVGYLADYPPGVVHTYVDQKVPPPNLIVRWFTLLKVKLWFIMLP